MASKTVTLSLAMDTSSLQAQMLDMADMFQAQAEALRDAATKLAVLSKDTPAQGGIITTLPTPPDMADPLDVTNRRAHEGPGSGG